MINNYTQKINVGIGRERYSIIFKPINGFQCKSISAYFDPIRYINIFCEY